MRKNAEETGDGILQVALTFDHDAISADVGEGSGVFERSVGELGPRVGLPRILALLAQESIPATFFVPVHTARTWPGDLAAIVAGGHEVACHGWAHEDHAALAPAAEKELIERQRSALTEAVRTLNPVAAAVRGFRAPYWSLSPSTLAFAEAAGFSYDSSLGWEETRITPVRHGDAHAREVSQLGRAGKLLEVPISRWLDDWAWFEPGRGGGPPATPSAFIEVVRAELVLAHERALNDASLRTGVLTYTFHPECIGRGSRFTVLAAIINTARTLPGVRFTRLDTAVARVSA